MSDYEKVVVAADERGETTSVGSGAGLPEKSGVDLELFGAEQIGGGWSAGVDARLQHRRPVLPDALHRVELCAHLLSYLLALLVPRVTALFLVEDRRNQCDRLRGNVIN